MNSIKLTVELGPETQSKLDRILEALLQGDRKAAATVAAKLTDQERATYTEMVEKAAEAIQERGAAVAEAIQETAQAIQAEAEKVTEETTPAAEETAPQSLPEAPAYTAADLLAMVQKLLAPGSNKGAKAKAIVLQYAPKVSAVPEDKRDEVMAALIALDQEG